MKFITSVFLAVTLALGAVHLTSCDVFTKINARNLGAQIAKSSLAVAVRVIAGEKVDVKREAALIGLQAASSAVATVTYNLSESPSATPLSLVSDSKDAAQSAIAAAAVADPQITAKAAEIATQAVAAAESRLNGAGAAPSGE